MVLNIKAACHDATVKRKRFLETFLSVGAKETQILIRQDIHQVANSELRITNLS